MTVTINFTKKFTRGTLEGLTYNDSITFVNAESAHRWWVGVNKNIEAGKLDYEIIWSEVV